VISGLLIPIGQQITTALPRQKLLQCSALSSRLTTITRYIKQVNVSPNNSMANQITQRVLTLEAIVFASQGSIT
jgi:hypothetical protein